MRIGLDRCITLVKIEEDEMKDLAKRCNNIFTSFWKKNREKIQQRGSFNFELNLFLGEYEKEKSKTCNGVHFYLYLYPNESQKYKVTFDDLTKQNIVMVGENETEILSPRHDAFDKYKEYATIVSAYAEAIKEISLEELIKHQTN